MCNGFIAGFVFFCCAGCRVLTLSLAVRGTDAMFSLVGNFGVGTGKSHRTVRHETVSGHLILTMHVCELGTLV